MVAKPHNVLNSNEKYTNLNHMPAAFLAHIRKLYRLCYYTEIEAHHVVFLEETYFYCTGIPQMVMAEIGLHIL